MSEKYLRRSKKRNNGEAVEFSQMPNKVSRKEKAMTFVDDETLEEIDLYRETLII